MFNFSVESDHVIQKCEQDVRLSISEGVSFVLMNSASEEAQETGNRRRKSIGSGGGSNLAGGQTRRYSIGVTGSRKSIGEEGNTVPNYLRASTGSCHDLCKFGKKHEHMKSAVPVKFKRTTVVDNDKLLKTVVPLEKKNTKLATQTPAEPVKVAKKDVLLAFKKPQVYKQSSSTIGKTIKNELKTSQRATSLVKSSPVAVKREVREGSNGGIEKKEIKTVKKTGVTPKTVTVKKVVAKVTTNESHSPKASFSRAVSLKGIKSRGVNQVSPLKDQNRMQKSEAVSEVNPETMGFDFTPPSMELVNPPVCDNTDSFSDKNVVEEESLIVHPVYESSHLFSDKEVLEELLIVESSQSCSDKEILEEEALIAPPVSESSESFYDDEVLENESGYTDDEEDGVLEEGSETANVNKIEDGNHMIPRKGKMVISEDKDDAAAKLRFRRGKVLDLQSENNGPRRLKFRRRVIEGNEDGQNISRKTYKNKTLDLQNEDKQRASRISFEKKYVAETNDSKNGPESIVLKRQGEQEKKDGQGLLNNVIEETASKLVESRKSKVKALVGAFETVISLQDGKPSST
ncbi:hypothetical protein L1987_43995 [Smallanthus sonchifolius]|uniref:Uncharacterized protein n=1 Tax=Smallanthus sonchifolius TaxID=185202 RepID=A0ACB9GQ86_9ASTR|nr:hypothetical protein L1987_43995 [Smallanthus sonchifolius]